jgi:predicted alpha-1,2-mannosidase
MIQIQMSNNILKSFLLLLLVFCASRGEGQNKINFADDVNPLIGVIGDGECIPGPCLPHASIHPSPNTLNCANGGYNYNEKITGFAQLHSDGTGGLPSYGNFLISPQIGLQTDEKKHGSDKSNEILKSYYYHVNLTKYNISCEVVPTLHSALYRFTYSHGDSAYILLDVARKLGGKQGLSDGWVKINPKDKSISGGGTFKSNWPSVDTRWQMYFYAKISSNIKEYGIWENKQLKVGDEYGHIDNSTPLGGFFHLQNPTKPVYLKIAISFQSVEHARQLLEAEIPGWNFERLKYKAKEVWNRMLGQIIVDGDSLQKELFYTNFFHSFIQPRNRTSDNKWKTDEPFWDDQYTMWDSWKTVYPLMCIVDPSTVAQNINSFISRHKHNGYVATAFINGEESAVGQGGNTVDNIICDAFIKKIPGIDWEKAYQVMKFNADSMRTPEYKKLGFQPLDASKGIYSWRLLPASATLAFSYNDYCVAQVAKGLGHIQDFHKYIKRSENWEKLWNTKAKSLGFSGFIMAKNRDGQFDSIAPKDGYNKHFYEGTCWEYSYVIPQDITEMVNKMGGRSQFVKRLKYALSNNLIDFGNEPSFMTLWLFSSKSIQRPNLTSYYVHHYLLPKYSETGLPGDDDQGAMGSLYVFANCGLFPVAGQNKYFLSSPTYKLIRFKLPNNKLFTISVPNASSKNIYIKDILLNGKHLNRYYITHDEIMKGGNLKFILTSESE